VATSPAPGLSRELALAAFPTLNPMGPLRWALVVLGEDHGLGGGLPLARYGAAA
jgi:hypothetical protein